MFYISGDTKQTGSENDHRNVNVCQLTLAPSANPMKILQSIVDVFQKGTQAPILVDLSLAEEILKYTSIDDAVNSKALMAKWYACNRPPQNGPSFFPSNYFDYLLGELPLFDMANLKPYFDCYGAMQKHDGELISVDLAGLLLSSTDIPQGEDGI
jgi:hypothetical protein